MFSIVQFTPDVSSGYEQCLWAREWALVDETLLEKKDYNSSLLIDSDEKLDCWFARKRSNLNPPGLSDNKLCFKICNIVLKIYLYMQLLNIYPFSPYQSFNVFRTITVVIVSVASFLFIRKIINIETIVYRHQN